MWSTCRDKSFYFKAHLVDEQLVELLVEDLQQRHPGFLPKLSRSQSAFFEPGGYGMYALKQPKLFFSLGEKELKLDAVKVAELALDLRLAKPRSFSDGTVYYKVHSRYCCLVLTEQDRGVLLTELDAKREEAEQQADIFFGAQKEVFAEYERVHGSPLIIQPRLKGREDFN